MARLPPVTPESIAQAKQACANERARLLREMPDWYFDGDVLVKRTLESEGKRLGLFISAWMLGEDRRH